MTTSLSTRVKRITPNQWRYYYNKLLLVEEPLSENFRKGVSSLAETVSGGDDRGSGRCSNHRSESHADQVLAAELEPIMSDNAIAMETAKAMPAPTLSHKLAPYELIRNELAKYEFTRQRLESTFNQVVVPNIYSRILLNRDSNDSHIAVVDLAINRDLRFVNSLVDMRPPIIGSVGNSIGLLAEQVVPIEPKIKEPPGLLAQVSGLLASFS